ncbi:hypothetical protein KQ872_01610 [Mycoplasma sp. ES3225-GEN-MYC]|nr:hypothetical protein [Mycoplasma miroungigenitalium]MBU4691657.1 hypothetical protein [Mycoplasma miroungigenitalium]
MRSQWNELFNDVVNKDDALVEIELINDSLIWVDEEYYNEEEDYYTGQIWNTYHHSTDAISGDEKVYSLKVRVKSKFVNRNVENHYNKLWNEALSVVSDEIVLDTDTGGNLMTNPLKGTNQKSNKYNLNKYFETLNNKLKDKNSSLVLSYKISSEDSAKNSIDVYVKDIATHSKNLGSKLLKSNIKIKYRATKWLENAKMDERLKINLGKYINFEEYDTKLVDDVLVRAENDKAIGNYGNTYYAGRWVAHTPLSVSFNTTLSENEVLIINGKKVDVLDQTFLRT